MICILDLIKLGQWLNERDLDTFGKNIREDDCILLVTYDKDYELKNITRKSELNLNSIMSSKSIFSSELFVSSDQKFMIPSNSNLLGLTPFCIKLDNDFIKKDKLDEGKINKFKNKVDRSFQANKNSNEFINEIKNLYKDKELLNSPISDESKKYLENLFRTHSLEDLEMIILNYYQFIFDNVDEIIDKIVEFKSSDLYDKKERRNFFMVCGFNNDYDLINDIFYYYSKFIKYRNKYTGNPEDENCCVCNNKGITVPSSGSFVTDKYYYFNNDVDIKNSHLKLCKKCNSFMFLAEDKLKKSLMSNVLLIPKSRDNSSFKMDEFIRILNYNETDFKKYNELLKEDNIIDYFDLDFAIYTQEQGDSYPIRKYVENYRSYLVQFDEINLLDESNSHLSYLFDEKIKIKEEQLEYFIVRNIFDIERIFRNYFTYVDSEGKTQRLILKYLYQIYSRDFSGKGGITYNLDSSTTSLFSKYMYNMFNFIYELNFNALGKPALDEIVFNCMMHYIKENMGESYGKYDYVIKERLNEYYMLMKEFWGKTMLNNENIIKIKEKFKNYEKDDDYDQFRDEVMPLIESSPYIKYYMMGQFIRYIDNFKRANGFNPEVFNNFMTNVNRNNIRKMFSTEILQKNNYYINQMNKKGKMLFEIIEKNLDSLFNEENISYEDYVLTLSTGYYTENVLSSKKEEGEKDD